MMRWYCCLLVVLLPNAVRLQDDVLDPESLAWLNRIINDTITTTTTSATLNKFNDPDLEQDFNETLTCTTDEGKPGLCVNEHQCRDGVIDNTTLIDLRDGSCPHYLQSCCMRSTIVDPGVTPLSSGCGWSNPTASIFRDKSETNINRKTYADYGEFPWMVALMRTSADAEKWKQTDYYGGGAIIHPSVVITVAHKVDWQTPGQIKCRAGEWDTQTTLELYPTQDRIVKKKIIHEEYYRTPAWNDVALLILETPFQLNDAPHIGVACLAPRLPASAATCYSMGWGTDFLKKNKYAVILKKVELGYVESGLCQTALQKTRLGPKYRLHASHICAGGELGVDTCKGDGGSSLVCPIEDGAQASRYAVYGLVAFGVDCGLAHPAVYLNIPKVQPWVDIKMIEEGFGTASYKY